jgi:hypothetical protein
MKIEFRDFVGVELECPECGAKIGYPFAKQYGRIATQCHNCNAPWLLPNSINVHPNTPTVAQELQAVLGKLQKLVADTGVKAHVRLEVAEPEPKP